MKIEIEKMDHKGNGIGFSNDKICFIPKSITGDIVEMAITKESGKYNTGKIEKIIKSSDDRIDAICPYYDICGGCNISNLTYQKQLEFKRDKVKNIFKRYLEMEINPEILGSLDEFKYRNKITYHVNDGKIGLVSIDSEVMPVDNCLLVSDKVNELYQKIKEEDLSRVKKITIKGCANGLILNITGEIVIDNIKDMCLSIIINDKLVVNNGDGFIMINNLKYKVSDKSFFQINTRNIARLYDVIVKYGNFTKDKKVIDLYCGVGSISLYIAKYVGKALGIEIIEDAIKDAKENARINGIDNVEFICGDVAKLVDDNLKGDMVIVDPPRIGMDKHTIEVLNNRDFNKIIYVSCEPMTLVRDVKLLDNYKLEDITLVDMFPQTHHVECVSVLSRKS